MYRPLHKGMHTRVHTSHVSLSRGKAFLPPIAMFSTYGTMTSRIFTIVLHLGVHAEIWIDANERLQHSEI